MSINKCKCNGSSTQNKPSRSRASRANNSNNNTKNQMMTPSKSYNADNRSRASRSPSTSPGCRPQRSLIRPAGLGAGGSASLTARIGHSLPLAPLKRPYKPKLTYKQYTCMYIYIYVYIYIYICMIERGRDRDRERERES